MLYWGPLMLAVVANVGANIALKTAMVSVSAPTNKEMIFQIVEKTSFWIGIACAGILLLSYLVAIRQMPVSNAYITVTSLAMVGLVSVEWLAYGTPLGISKILGMVLVICGISLLTKAV